MPHHKSAAKRLKTNEKSRLRNVALRSALRKHLKRQAAATEEAVAGIPATYSELDRAVRKGLIPKSRANRLKSRNAIRANKTVVSS